MLFRSVALSCKKVDVGDDDFVAVSKVSLNHSNETLTLGGTLQLVATVEPANASKKTVKWSTSSSDIASVSSEGLVSASKIGNATITAEAGGVSATCKINVVAEAIPVYLRCRRERNTSLAFKSRHA